MSHSTLLVLQHIACEPPAAYEDELRAQGFDLIRVELDEGQPLPDWRGFAGVLAMGGPMAAYDDDRHHWLAAEKRMIGDAVRAGVPFWGVCLGAQLLAASLGARVFPGREPEVGVLPVQLTAAATGDPVFGALPAEFQTLQWHSDTYELPAGAVRLAGSPAYPQQAFTWRRAYGLQFHLEVSPELAVQWARVPAYAASLDALQGPGALPRLVDELAIAAVDAIPLARTLFARWLQRVVRAGPQASPAAARTSGSVE